MEANAEKYRTAEKRRDAAQGVLKLAGERLQNAQKTLNDSYKKEKEAAELRSATAASDAPGKLAALREKQATVEKKLQELAAGKGKLEAALAASGRELAIIFVLAAAALAAVIAMATKTSMSVKPCCFA